MITFSMPQCLGGYRIVAQPLLKNVSQVRVRFRIGQGRTRVKFVRRVKYNTMVWGDTMFMHPDMIARLPK